MKKSSVLKEKAPWTFLSNHAHVLICVSKDPEVLLRKVAQTVGITERAIQRIVAELEEAGYLRREKSGRQNRYYVKKDLPLRHSLEAHCKVGALLSIVLEGKRR